MNKLHTLSVILSFPILIYSQNIEIGPSIGLSLYHGDLTPEGFSNIIQSTNLTFGAFGRLNFPSNISLKLGTQFTKLSGDDANSTSKKNRSLNFETEVIELTLTGEWNFLRLGSSRYGAMYPFIYGGIGGYYFTPRANFEGELVDLYPLGTEGQGLIGYPGQYSRMQAMIPLGLGLKIDMEDFGSIILELGARKLFTDYIDDVSGVEVNYRELLEGNGELAARLSLPTIDPEDTDNLDFNYTRGSSTFNDWYYIVNVSIAIPLGSIDKDGVRSSGIGCPRF